MRYPISPNPENRAISNRNRNSDTPLFPSPSEDALPSLFSITSERVREALRQDLKASRYSREQISIDLSRVTGRKYSVAMLDAFIAESKPHRFPAELVPAWCTTLQSTRLLDAIAGELGLSLASEQDRQFAELGRVHLKQQQLTQTLWGPTR